MNIQIQISLSCSLLDNSDFINFIIKLLLKKGNQIRFVVNDCNCDTHSISLSKLQIACSGSFQQPQYSLRIWADADILSPILLSNQHFHLVIMNGSSLSLSGCRTAIPVNQWSQLAQLLGLSLSLLQKRCELQQTIARRTHRYKNWHSCQKIREIAVKKHVQWRKKSIRQVVGFLGYFQRRRRVRLERVWSVWLISHYQSRLCELDSQLCRQGYLSFSSNRQLLGLCFRGWKQLIFVSSQR